MGALFLAIRLISVPIPDHSKTKPSKAVFRDTMAGIFLAFSILKPILTIPAMAGILVWAIIERRSHLIAGFAACIGILSLASWFAVGNLVPD